jgi:hypothetical protein
MELEVRHTIIMLGDSRAWRFDTGNAFQVPASSSSSVIDAGVIDAGTQRLNARTPYAAAPDSSDPLGQDLFPKYSRGTGTRRVQAVPVTYLSCRRPGRGGAPGHWAESI